MADVKAGIMEGRTSLGIELGSTRIKAVLIDEDFQPIASGSHDWENRLIDGIWTYSLEDVWAGLQDCFAKLRQEVRARYDLPLARVGAIGLSAMMHGYLPFDREGRLLTPFRTWRNTMTAEAAAELTALFGFNIPQRWSVAHLYQAVLRGEPHVPELAFLTTLAGYVHWRLTGMKVVGVGEASGIFPIDSGTGSYDEAMLGALEGKLAAYGFPWKAREIFPRVLSAGESAGTLTEEGARLLDPSGGLKPGIPFCPPEGDAGTGMVATNSVLPRTGNVSAGTSVFSMVVLDRPLSKVYPEIDLVTTPSGSPVAMVHCNNCTTDLNAWVALFGEFAAMTGLSFTPDQLYGSLYRKALEGDADAGGLVAYNFYSGEHILGLEEGRPLFVRSPESRFTLANFMRSHLYASLSVLKAGMDILTKRERVKIDRIFGHGGLFKTKGVGQRILAAAIHAPVYVMETAGEGGAWGAALLAEYRRSRAEAETLADFLAVRVFHGSTGEPMRPRPEDEAGFEAFSRRYLECLPAERAAIEALK